MRKYGKLGLYINKDNLPSYRVFFSDHQFFIYWNISIVRINVVLFYGAVADLRLASASKPETLTDNNNQHN
jgi:hypothetical protein